MKKIHLVLIVFLLLHLTSNVFAKPDRQIAAPQNPEVEKAYRKGLQLYLKGRYGVAAWELQNMLMLFPKNRRTTSALYLIARADFHLKKYREANEALDQLLKDYPQTAYRYDALFLKAAIAYNENKLSQSFNLLAEIIHRSKNKNLVRQSQKIFYKTVLSNYALPDIRNLQGRFSSSDLKPIWMLAAASKMWDAGDFEQAKKKLQTFFKKYPNSLLIAEARNLQKMIEKGPSIPSKIAVVLPITGFYREQATDVANGIKLAFANWKQSHSDTKLQLNVFDTHRNTIQALKITQKLAGDRNVLAILGSLESDPTGAIGAVASCKNLPLIAPTGTENGIAALGENIFQMDGNIDIRGKILAEYAIQQLHLKTFAVLAPADEYGKQITDSFTEMIDHLGGKIMAETWYYEGSVDFKRQLSHIRNVGLEKMVWDSLRTVYPGYSDSEIDSLFAIEEPIRQAQNRNKVIRKLADSTAVPVTSIDGVFLPVYTDDIKYIAPQYAMFNIQSQLLGGDYWKDISILNDNQSYVNGVIFTTDVFAKENALPYLRFQNRYRKRFQTSPSKFSVLGYDSMNYLLQALNSGARTREDLLKALRNIREFDGLHGSFKFLEGSRVNSGIVLLRFENGTFRKLE